MNTKTALAFSVGLFIGMIVSSVPNIISSLQSQSQVTAPRPPTAASPILPETVHPLKAYFQQGQLWAEPSQPDRDTFYYRVLNVSDSGAAILVSNLTTHSLYVFPPEFLFYHHQLIQ